MPNLQPKILYIGNGTGSNVYTVSNTTGNYSIIKSVNICNANTANTKTVSLHILPPTTSPAANNIFLSNISIPANDIAQLDVTLPVQAGYAIHIIHSGDITTTISGVEYS